MRKVSSFVLAGLAGLAASSAAMADFTFSLSNQSNVTTSWRSINLTTAASIPNDTYTGVRIQYDFDSNPNGTSSSHAWSNEGRATLSSTGGSGTGTSPTFGGGNTNWTSGVTIVTGGASNANDVAGIRFNLNFTSPLNFNGSQSIFWNYRQAFGNAAGQQVDWNNVSVTFISFVPPTPPAGAINLGTLAPGGMLMAQTPYVSNTVQWYKFTLGTAIPAGDQFLAHTFGNTLSGGQFGTEDTEIALFNSAGNVLGNNDDTGSFRWSTLSSTAGLAAGDYYIAASAYNLAVGPSFSASVVDAVAVGGAVTGDIKLTIIPAPATAGLLGLGGLLAARRRR